VNVVDFLRSNCGDYLLLWDVKRKSYAWILIVLWENWNKRERAQITRAIASLKGVAADHQEDGDWGRHSPSKTSWWHERSWQETIVGVD